MIDLGLPPVLRGHRRIRLVALEAHEHAPHIKEKGAEPSLRPNKAHAIADSYLKLAVTDKFAFIVSVQVVAEPLQAPAQPIHGNPGSGVAVSVTAVPAA